MIPPLDCVILNYYYKSLTILLFNILTKPNSSDNVFLMKDSFTPTEVGTLVERLEGKLDAVLEVVVPMSEDVAKIKEEMTSAKDRLTLVEDAVRVGFPAVNKRLDRVETRLDGVEVRLDRVEIRLSRIESKS